VAKKNKEATKEIKAPVMVVNENGKWSIDRATKMISRNGGIVKGKGIFHPTAGLKVLGAMDYLINHAGFHKSLA
jgi:hypothetical protein